MSFILSTRRHASRFAMMASIALCLAACGQKGPLKLPVPPTPPGSQRPVPAPEEPVQVSEPPSPGTGQQPVAPPPKLP